MMEESIKMIHDTSTRLEKAVVELVDLIVRPVLRVSVFVAIDD
jgi:hypothetical protein